MSLIHPDNTETIDAIATDADALFKEARQRERRRRASIALALGVGIAAVVAMLLLVTGGGARGEGGGGPGTRVQAPAPVGDGIAPKEPTAMAVSPSGTLYVLDAGRDQILRLTRAGRFVVFAGSGVHGFSGDGGAAAKARLRLNNWSDLVVGANGVVYISDSGNGRVRAVRPDGVIETVAGDGGDRPTLQRWRGTRSALGLDIGEPHGLAVGPGGALYIGAEDLIRVTPTSGGGDAARWLAGSSPLVHTRFGSIPTLQSEFSNAYGTLALGRAGAVYVENSPNLYERTGSGKLLSLGSYRAGDNPAPLVNGLHGGVYGADLDGIFRVDGSNPAVARDRRYIVSNRRLDDALGWRRLARRPALISPPGGIAVAPNGTVYYNTNSSNGWAPTSALMAITPKGKVRVLWRPRS